MKLKKLLPAALAMLLSLALIACGTAYENGESTEQTTTQAYDTTWPETEILDFSPVFVNGENVAGAQILRDEEYWPTHVTLMAVLDVFGTAIAVEDGVVTMEGLNGEITFAVGSNEFDVDGETVTLDDESLEIHGTLYVPLAFFRDVFGALSASVLSGEVNIDTHQAEDGNF